MKKQFFVLCFLNVFLFCSLLFVSCDKEEARNEIGSEQSIDEAISIEEQEANEKLKNADLSLDELNNLDDSSSSSSDIKE